MQVFLSYSNSDKELARDLAKGLSKYGHKVWFADQHLLPGDNWSLEVGKALENSDAMVVVLSGASSAFASELQSREVQYALGSPHYSHRVIPVLVPPVESIPNRLPWILKNFAAIEASANPAEISRLIDRALGEKKRHVALREKKRHVMSR
jgi:hypothetical protein